MSSWQKEMTQDLCFTKCLSEITFKILSKKHPHILQILNLKSHNTKVLGIGVPLMTLETACPKQAATAIRYMS